MNNINTVVKVQVKGTTGRTDGSTLETKGTEILSLTNQNFEIHHTI